MTQPSKADDHAKSEDEIQGTKLNDDGPEYYEETSMNNTKSDEVQEKGRVDDECVQIKRKMYDDAEEEDDDFCDDDDDDSHIRRPKRSRTAYSGFQLDQLEWVFSQTHYPDVLVRQELSARLNIQEVKLQVWFQNRRARWRKQQRTGCVSSRSRSRKRSAASMPPASSLIPTPSLRSSSSSPIMAPWMMAQTMQGSGVPIPGMYGASTTSGYSPTTSICQTESHLQPLPPICTAAKPLTQSFTAPCIPSSGRQSTHAGAHLPPGGIPYPQLMNFPMMSVAPQQISHEGDAQGYSGAFQSCAVHEN